MNLSSSLKITTIVNTLRKKIKSLFQKNPDKLLKKVRGVIHVGANTGQEIQLYVKYGLSVVWIEPIPEVFETLKSNLTDISKSL